MLKYSQLTQEQKKYICNGCGGKGECIKVPNFIFLASCNQHDFYFWRGCTKADFKKANNEFYKWMKEDIKGVSKWYKKTYFHIWAYVYYKAVQYIGKKYFYFASTAKTLEDLEN